MALRIRKNGDIVCAAMTEPNEGDTYINDSLHYEMSVINKVIVAPIDHNKTALWFWKGNIPKDVEIDDFYLD